MTEAEWADLKLLAEHEAAVLRPGRAGFENIFFNNKRVPDGATLEPENSFLKAKTKTKESFFYPNGHEEKEPKMA